MLVVDKITWNTLSGLPVGVCFIVMTTNSALVRLVMIEFPCVKEYVCKLVILRTVVFLTI